MSNRTIERKNKSSMALPLTVSGRHWSPVFVTFLLARIRESSLKRRPVTSIAFYSDAELVYISYQFEAWAGFIPRLLVASQPLYPNTVIVLECTVHLANSVAICFGITIADALSGIKMERVWFDAEKEKIGDGNSFSTLVKRQVAHILRGHKVKLKFRLQKDRVWLDGVL